MDSPDRTSARQWCAPERAPPGLRDPALRIHAGLFVLFGGAVTVLWTLTRDATPSPTHAGSGYGCTSWVVLVWAPFLALHALHACGRLPRRPHGR